jgi:hypothetical protein
MQQSLSKGVITGRLTRVEILETLFVSFPTTACDSHVPKNLQIADEST